VEGRDEVPLLLPARMLNEFAYCPRLFHLEWSSGLFAHNLDTAEGTFAHRRVDRPEGHDSEDGELPPVTRSLLLSSERLGLVARIDALHAEDGQVIPVDAKKGRPPENAERAWEPERVQLCAQGLLLRDAGHVCDLGYLWFAGARRRVEVVFDDELVTRTLELIEQAREVASVRVAPPPLVDSPKCPRCSLVGICLPDEVNHLAARSESPPRRLIPTGDAARPIYVDEQGARVGFSRGRVTISRRDEELASVRPADISQVCVFGNVQVTTQALGHFFARDVPVAFFSHGGWFRGIAHGMSNGHVELRRHQVARSTTGDLGIARALVAGKIANSRTLLRRNARQDVSAAVQRLADARAQAQAAGSLESLIGIEGAAARTYFGSFEAMLAPPERLPGETFTFEGRNRRPPRDPVNTLLSYTYSLLTKDLTTVAHLVGFDSGMGFLHRERFGRPALALDLAEEFRPLVAESTVLQVINNGEVDPGDFVVRAGGVQLTKRGRTAVLRAYERRLDHELTHPVFGYRATYRRQMEIQARVLAAVLLGEVPGYTALTTR
jgi:CRISP-associated protein Cas1